MVRENDVFVLAVIRGRALWSSNVNEHGGFKALFGPEKETTEDVEFAFKIDKKLSEEKNSS